MPDYKPVYTEYTDPVNFMLRLTAKDTIFANLRMQQAIREGIGASLVFLSCDGAFSLTKSPERGKQIKCIAFNKAGIRVDSEMKGYNGPWSHFEIAHPLESIAHMQQFIDNVKRIRTESQLSPIKMLPLVNTNDNNRR